MTQFEKHPFALPEDVSLNDNERIVLSSLLSSAAGQGYDFGYADYDEATEEAQAAMNKGARSYRAYLGSLSKKGLIDVLETEKTDEGNPYTQFYVTMPEFNEPTTADATPAPVAETTVETWTAEALMNFRVFYSKRELIYLVNVTGNDFAYVKGNKRDFYDYLASLEPTTELPNVIVEDNRILVG